MITGSLYCLRALLEILKPIEVLAIYFRSKLYNKIDFVKNNIEQKRDIV